MGIEGLILSPQAFMNNRFRTVIIILSIIAGAISGIAFSYFVLWPILIPDQCYYDVHETNWFIELFFSFPAYEGYHPFPSLFNLLLFGFVGSLGGKRIAKTALKI